MMRYKLGESEDSWSLPTHIKVWSADKKLSWLLTKLDPIVSELYMPYPTPDDFFSTFVPINIEGQLFTLVLPMDSQDELLCTTSCFVRAMMDFMIFDRLIHDGDIEQIPSMLKRLAVDFIGLTTNQSKYAIECINLITKLEWVLPP
jgi:hypothetical protein